MSIYSTLKPIFQKFLKESPQKMEDAMKRQCRKDKLDYRSVCFEIESLKNEADSPEKEEKLNHLLRKKEYLEERIQKYESY